MPREKRNPPAEPRSSKCTMYHATLQANYWHASSQGLLTANDRRKKGRIWLADIQEIGYVIEHLAASRGMSVSQWAILAVRVDLLPAWPCKSGRTGIYYVTADIPPTRFELFETRWIGFELDDVVCDEFEHIYECTPEGKFRPAPTMYRSPPPG